MRELSISFDGYWIVVAICIAIVFLALVYIFYRRTNPPISRGMRITLGIMRSAAICLLLFSLASPLISFLTVSEMEPHVALLFDNSESIKTVEDFDLKKGVIDFYAENPLPGQTTGFIRDDFSFADSLADLTPPLTLDAKSTALGECLSALRDRYVGLNLRSVIVFSDGLVNSGASPLKAAAELQVPVHTVDLGPQKSSNDIRIVELVHDDVAYAGKTAQIEIEVESSGFEQVRIPVSISSRGRTLSTKEIRLSGNRARQSVQIEFVPPDEGVSTFTVSLPAQPDEELTDNNGRTFRMKVLKSKQRVLLAAGYLSWELTFLKRILDQSEDYEYDLSVFDRNGNLKTAPFASSPEELRKYDLIVLIDYAPSILASKVSGLRRYVEDYGGAVMFMLGTEFSRSSPAGKLAEMLPFDLSESVLAHPGSEFHLRLTEAGKYHPVMRIDDETADLQSVWNDLPPFQLYLTAGMEKPGTTVLAVHPEPDYHGRLIPLVTASRVGRGKLLTTCVAPVWRIDFVSRDNGGTGNRYRRFIDNCIKWLATKEDAQRLRVWPDESVFRSGEHVTFSASLYDESYQALSDASAILTVYPDSGVAGDTLISTMVMTAHGKLRSDFHLLDEGSWRYSAEVRRGDNVETIIEGDFLVEAFSLEEETLYEDDNLLAELAAATGGRNMPLSMIDSLAGLFDLGSSEKRIWHEFPLSNHWIVLLAVLVLLSAEWAMRKRLELL